MVGDAEEEITQHKLFGRVSYVEGVILLPHSSSSDTIIRIGLFTIGGEENTRKLLAEHTSMGETIINLI
jgi:hypothetical protein